MSLDGIGNKLNHQRIVSDLIFAIRKNFAKHRITDMEVLPEISISALDYEYAQDETIKHDYNFDLAIIDNQKNLLMIVEVEGGKSNKNKIKEKMKDCLENINTLEEVMSIEYNTGELLFYHYTIKDGELKKEKTSSHSHLLNMNLKTSIVSCTQ